MVVLWVLAGLVGLILAVLAVPVVVRVRATTEPRARLRVEAGPFRAWVPGVTLVDSAAPRKNPGSKEKKARPGGGGGPGKARLRRMLAAAPDLVRGILSKFRVEHLRADAEFGTGDPAETGALWGALTPVLYAVPGGGGAGVSLRPVFDDRIFSGEVDVAVRVVPLSLAGPLLAFGWAVVAPWR